MKHLTAVCIAFAVIFSMCVPFCAEIDEVGIRELVDTAEPFFRSYVESIFVDEAMETDYSAFVENEHLINYLEAKKDVYRLYEKYYGEVSEFNIDWFHFGSLEPVFGDSEMISIPLFCSGKNITEKGVELPFVGSPVFTFIKEDGKLRIYDVYICHEIDYDIRGFYQYFPPAVTYDLTDEVKAYAVDFEENLKYLVENPQIVEADEAACAELSLKYISDFYTELYDTADSDGIFESGIKYENDTVKEYFEKRSYYYNSPKRYDVETSMQSREYKVLETQYWGGVVYCEIQCIHSKNGGRSSHTEFLAFVKNADGEYLLRDVLDSTVVNEIYRGLGVIYLYFYDYIGLNSYADDTLISAIETAQLDKDVYWSGVQKKAEAQSANRQEAQEERELANEQNSSNVVNTDDVMEEPDTTVESVGNISVSAIVIGVVVLSVALFVLMLIMILKKKN